MTGKTCIILKMIEIFQGLELLELLLLRYYDEKRILEEIRLIKKEFRYTFLNMEKIEDIPND